MSDVVHNNIWLIKGDKMKDKPLIIYLDEHGETKTVFSEYEIHGILITFLTAQNKLTIPLSRLIKIKENKDGEYRE